MLLKMAKWAFPGDPGAGGTHDALATEAKFLHYSIVHEFNKPAYATAVLADPAGAMRQKYKNVGDGTSGDDTAYIGPGRFYLEDPTATGILDGRIIKASPSLKHRLVLTGADWLHQLTERRINYDTRENLGAGIREIPARPFCTAGGPCNAFFTQGGTHYVKVDSTALGSTWANDAFNAMKLIFPYKHFGSQVDTVYCYDEAVSVVHAGGSLTDTPANGETNLWADDGDEHVVLYDNAGTGNDPAFAVFYDFKTLSKDSSLFSKVTAVRVEIVWKAYGNIDNVYLDIDLGATWLTLYKGTVMTSKQKASFSVPGEYLSDVIKAGGELDIRIELTSTASNGWAKLEVDYIAIEIEYETDDTIDAAITIDDTFTPNLLEVATDLVAAGAVDWFPFCVCQIISNHINGLVTDYDPIMAMTTSIEASTKYYAQHFPDVSPLYVLGDLAKADGAVFWVALGSKQVTWKRTFAANGNTLADTDVTEWLGDVGWEYNPVRNEYHIRGIRSGGEQLYFKTSALSPDPGLGSKLLFGTVRTEAISDGGVYTVKHAEDLGDALVKRDRFIPLILRCKLAGLSSLRLGDHVAITSTINNLSADDYIVTSWKYSSQEWRTELRLHPLSTLGFIDSYLIHDSLRRVYNKVVTQEARHSIDPGINWTETVA